MPNKVSAGSRKGFTLIEALASAALLGVGIAAAVGTLGAIAGAETRARDRALVQQLAMQKYDELISTNTQTLASTSGDFSDRNMSGYTWNMTLDPSQVSNLDTVKVTVQRSGAGDNSPVGTAEGLIYISPNATSTTPTTTTGGTGGGG